MLFRSHTSDDLLLEMRGLVGGGVGSMTMHIAKESDSKRIGVNRQVSCEHRGIISIACTNLKWKLSFDTVGILGVRERERDSLNAVVRKECSYVSRYVRSAMTSMV